VLVSIGDRVTAGQTLAIADTTALENEIATAQASHELALIRLEEAKQALKDAKTAMQRQVTNAQAAIDAARVLVNDAKIAKNNATAVGGTELRMAKVALIQAQDQMRQAKQLKLDAKKALDGDFPSEQAAVNEVKETIASLTADISDLESQLELATLVAPVGGVVTAVNVKPGFAAPMSGAIELDGTTLQVVANVVESDVSSMALGQTATVNIGALGQRATGTVTSVAPTTDGATDSVVTYPVTVTLDEPDANVKPGMSSDVEIIIAEAPDVIAVPAVALDGRAANRTVQVLLPDGSVEARPVTVGLVNETLAEIQSGVAAGEEVVVGTVSEKVEAEASSGGLVGGGNVPGSRALQGGGNRAGGN
jgi:RND family efflux transporter MFP subunit